RAPPAPRRAASPESPARRTGHRRARRRPARPAAAAARRGGRWCRAGRRAGSEASGPRSQRGRKGRHKELVALSHLVRVERAHQLVDLRLHAGEPVFERLHLGELLLGEIVALSHLLLLGLPAEELSIPLLLLSGASGEP